VGVVMPRGNGDKRLYYVVWGWVACRVYRTVRRRSRLHALVCAL